MNHKFTLTRTLVPSMQKYYLMISKLFSFPFPRRLYSIDITTYNKLADHALDYLYDSIEQVIDKNSDFDASLAMGVLTVRLGTHGTFVLNKQPPNLQIWLSSPISGPKRFDYDESASCWIYKRDGSSLTSLLSKELTKVLSSPIILKIPPLQN
jgi:frataxin